MRIKRIFSAVLAGLVALSVTACGSVDDSEEKKKDLKTNDNERTVEETVDMLENKLQETADVFSKALSGELDFAYTGSAEIEFGSYVTNKLGKDLKPVTINAAAKQRGGKTQTDISLAYDQGTLISLNAVADNEAQVAYFKIPELSDAYVAISADELKAMFEEKGAQLENIIRTNVALGDAENFDLDSLKDTLSDIDISALFDDFKSYCDAAAEKVPEGRENGTVTGEINGYSYSYDVETIDFTGQVLYDIIDTVIEKAKNDDLLKDTFAKFGVTADQYNAAVDEFAANIKEQDLSGAAFTIDLYKSGDQYLGFSFTDAEGKNAAKLAVISQDDVIAFDFGVTSDGKSISAAKGSFTTTDDILNGSIDISAEDSMTASVVFTNIKEEGDLFSGTVSINIAADGSNIAAELVSASTDSKADFTITSALNGENIFKLTILGEKTDASDITMPTGTIYQCNDNDLKAYAESCDIQGFISRFTGLLDDIGLGNILNSLGGIEDSFDLAA